MGLVFGDWSQGVRLFRSWVEAVGHADEHDDLRVAIIEGDVPGKAPGYSVRISPSFADYLHEDQQSDGSEKIGRVRRMHPALGNAPYMLGRFKDEYEKHGEFMLAPVVTRDDDQLWFNPNQGIIKRELVLRRLDEIDEHEPDALAAQSMDDGSLVAPATPSDSGRPVSGA